MLFLRNLNLIKTCMLGIHACILSILRKLRFMLMDNSWIKLYRKIGNNEILRDRPALQLFVFLLIHVDKNTGEYKTGRNRLAALLKINPNTLKDVIKRCLIKHQIITLQTTNKYTIFRLINWDKYQQSKSSSPIDHQNPTQYDTTKQEYREKEEEREKEKSFSTLAYLKNLPLEDIEALQVISSATKEQVIDKAVDLHDYCLAKGRRYKNYKAFLSKAVRRDYPKVKTQFIAEAMGYKNAKDVKVW